MYERCLFLTNTVNERTGTIFRVFRVFVVCLCVFYVFMCLCVLYVCVYIGGEGTDMEPWMEAGVPGASLANDNEHVRMSVSQCLIINNYYCFN